VLHSEFFIITQRGGGVKLGCVNSENDLGYASRVMVCAMVKVAKTAQEIQDDIFRKMSADEKLEVWVGLWRLAKDLTGDSPTWRIP